MFSMDEWNRFYEVEEKIDTLSYTQNVMIYLAERGQDNYGLER